MRRGSSPSGPIVHSSVEENLFVYAIRVPSGETAATHAASCNLWVVPSHVDIFKSSTELVLVRRPASKWLPSGNHSSGKKRGCIRKRPRLPGIYLKHCQSVRSIRIGQGLAIRRNCVANNWIFWWIGCEFPLDWITPHFSMFPPRCHK